MKAETRKKIKAALAEMVTPIGAMLEAGKGSSGRMIDVDGLQLHLSARVIDNRPSSSSRRVYAGGDRHA